MNLKLEEYKGNGDFKKYFCKTSKRNYWVLGYFGGGAINFLRFAQVAETFHKETRTPYENIQIDEILKSNWCKGFKVVWSDNNKIEQPIEGAFEVDDLWYKLTSGAMKSVLREPN